MRPYKLQTIILHMFIRELNFEAICMELKLEPKLIILFHA